MKDRKMTLKTMVLWTAIVVLLMVSGTTCTISARSVEQINKGIDAGQKAVDFISKRGPDEEKGQPLTQVNKIFRSVGKFASFLGAAGGLISFVLSFIPQAESAELKYMKAKFGEVNLKLDRITSELDNIKALITYENQRSVYVGSASKILFAHKQLSVFLDELESTPCQGEKNCKRVRARIASRYVDDFRVKQDIFKILNGAIKSTSAFGDPLLVLTKTTFKCDVGKIDQLANSILALSFKAQQVILAYEKLTGSKFSITQNMNDWLKSIYDLRTGSYKIKRQCLDQISSHMKDDVEDEKYQVGVSSNDQANREVKEFMETKYYWLGWVAHSYQAHGISKHCILGAFRNMPDDPNKRKRNVIVTQTDKSGTYTNQKYIVLKALDNIVGKIIYLGKNVCTLLGKIEVELRKEQVWKYIRSLNVLKTTEGLAISADNHLTYISKHYKLKFSTKVRLVIVLKSMEEANGVVCDKSCNGQGSCESLPYSSAKYCRCNPYYEGAHCEEHAKAQLAKTMDALLEITLTLPMLSDIAYDIEDLREYVGISFGKIESAISELEAAFKKAFDDLSRKLTNHFQWSNLITHYSDAIRKIEFYAYRFEELPKRYPTTLHVEGKKLATAVLAADGIEKWLYELNYLFLGRTGTPLLNHEPLLVLFITRYASQACSPAYKAAVNHTWSQLVLLQQMGFMIWAQALEIMGRPTEHAAQLYKTRTAIQISKLNQTTCEYTVANSVNVQCSGGRYLHPAISIANKCKANYYLNKTDETTCVAKSSECIHCNCSATGSNNSECTDVAGRCSCKAYYYGKKCANRDCAWEKWSPYSSCSMRCGYGGTKTKTRSHNITKQGEGKACNGTYNETTTCFNGCCSGQFHCSGRKKCISSSYRCDYNNQCGNRQDEWSCSESCYTRATGWNSDGGGNMVYFDRHRLSCGGSGRVLQMFRLQRRRGQIRFFYKCCQLLKSVCSNYRRSNGYSSDGGGDTVYLDRQTVSCGSHGYLNGYWLERGHGSVRYSYYCCNLYYSSHRARTRCYTRTTGWTYDGNGKSYYLDRQTVQCGQRQFLTYFKLERNGRHDHWRYRYQCCRIVT